jgi:uncharacterized membrane protein HdeD (DUF308 family)
LHALAVNWWLLFLRGMAGIAFGVLVIVWPALSPAMLVNFYGIFALVDGVLALTAAIIGVLPASRWWLALTGLLDIAIGCAVLAWPGSAALVLLTVMAGWAIAVGIAQIIGAIWLRKEIDNEWLLIASGVLSLAFGLRALGRPAAGALAATGVIGVYFIVYGYLMARLALQLRQYSRD